MDMDNPFKAGCYNGIQTYSITADDRISAVEKFDISQCLAALRVPHLQRTVERAIHSRLRKLERGNE